MTASDPKRTLSRGALARGGLLEVFHRRNWAIVPTEIGPLGGAMTLSDVASVGSLISGAAVLGSLVYLSLQVRQADRNQQAIIRQNRSIRLAAQWLSATDPSVAEAVSKGLSGATDLSRTQLAQFLNFARGRLYGVEDDFYQHSDGLMSESAFARFVTVVRQGMPSPGMQAAWRLYRDVYGIEFVKFMDGLMAETPAARPTDALARWKADIADIMS